MSIIVIALFAVVVAFLVLTLIDNSLALALALAVALVLALALVHGQQPNVASTRALPSHLLPLAQWASHDSIYPACLPARCLLLLFTQAFHLRLSAATKCICDA